MNRNGAILFFSLIPFALTNTCFSQTISSLDSSAKAIKPFYIQADLFLPITSHILANIDPPTGYAETQPNNYTFSAGYFFDSKNKVKKSLQLTALYYTDDGLDWDNATFFYDVQTMNMFVVNPEIKFLFNKKSISKGFFINAGLGFFHQSFKGADFYSSSNKLKLYEKKIGWDVMACAGYKLSVKRFYFDFLLGGGSYFVSKRYLYHVYTGDDGLYFSNQKNYPNPSVKSLTTVNSSTLLYKYKYLGAAQGAFFPRVGINLGFTF